MRERPILFSEQMVKAIISGRKTQTRRVIKPQPTEEMWDTARANLGGDTHGATPVVGFMGTLGLLRSAKAHARLPQADTMGPGTGFIEPNIRCPYGQPGDRLWVRETRARASVYHLDGQEIYVYPVCDSTTDYGGPWKPSIHMPRAASRITLEITGVRVERLRQITGGGSVSEGYPHRDPATFEADQMAHAYGAATDWFRDLWESIHGPGTWAANQWVWVIEFRRVTP